MKDNVGQEVKQGDAVATVSDNRLYIGILLKITAKGNATVCTSIGKRWDTKAGQPFTKSGRPHYIKIGEEGMSEEQTAKLKQIREYYGYLT
tara:strand:+ start:1284 stop:1556 length:273 start_codon:yes stop_codon:yes gene_type:complete